MPHVAPVAYRIITLVLHAAVALVPLRNIGIEASVAATATTSTSLTSAAATSSSSKALASASDAVATSTSLGRAAGSATASVVAACPGVATTLFLLRRMLLL